MLKGLTPSVFCIISDRKSTFPTDLELIYGLKILNCDFPFVTGDDNNLPHSDFYFLYHVLLFYFLLPLLDMLVSHISEDQKKLALPVEKWH